MLPPHQELVEYIDYYWHLSIVAPLIKLQVIPDTAIDLVLSPDMPEFAALYFPSIKKFDIPLQGPVHYAGICFRPAAINVLLGSDLKELRKLDIGTDIIENLGLGSITNIIQNCKNLPTLKNYFDIFWQDRLASATESPGSRSTLSLSELINILEDSLGKESLSSVCHALGISERQFRRLSNELFGLSPKKIQNVLRLQVAVTELFECKSQQIQDLYYDESHRIRELKQLTGFTPQKIRQMAEKYNQP